MRHQRRLRQLERQVASTAPPPSAPAGQEADRQYRAWLAGEAPCPPDPPCPPGAEPKEWASQWRVNIAVGHWLRGEWRDGVFPAGTTPDEAWRIQGHLEALAAFQVDLETAYGPSYV
jgi:hypothetical protein